MAARQRRPPPSIGKGAGTLAIAVLVLATGLTLFRAQAAPTSARAEDARPWDRLSGPLFQTFGQDQGLPPMTPTAIAQDGDGFVWIGTQGGLIRWDGYHFLTYSATPGGPNGLPGGWISALHTDPSGRLWIGTDADGLAWYDRNLDRFVAAPIGPDGDRRRHVGAIADDGAGGLWVGADDGLRHLTLGGPPGGPARVREIVAPAGLRAGRILALLRDRGGRLWVGGDNGLSRLDPAASAFAAVPMTPAVGHAPAVSALFQDREGVLWIGTTQRGVFVAAPGERAAEPFVARHMVQADLRSARVSAIAPAGDHEIWVGMRASGVAVIDTRTRRVRRLRHDSQAPDSLSHDDVWTLFGDRAGSLWVGGGGGLSYHPRDMGTVRTVSGGASQGGAPSRPDPSSLLATRNGRLWLGYLGGGVDILDPRLGRVASIPADPGHPASALPKDVVTEMAVADDGSVHIGTARGVYRTDPEGRGVTLERPAARDPHGYVRALLVDGPNLWIGGPDGLWRMPIATGAPVAVVASGFRRLSDQSVFTLLKGDGRTLWVGTMNGLNRLDLASGAIETIFADPFRPSALPVRLISSLAQDQRGRLWVGTFGGGVAVMTGRDTLGRPRFVRIGAAEGLPNLNVDRLLRDGAGMMWVSTDDGLAVIDPASLRVRAVRRADGAALSVYWVKSGATDAWGEPVFGAKGGLSVVRPGWPATRPSTTPVVVSDVRIGGKPTPGGRFNGAGSAIPLVLTPGTNSLAVEFSALDFSEPARTRYAYRLTHFDEKWIETDANRRLAAYTNLPPGDYVLELRASERDGAWTPALHVPVHVRPRWHQTLWARLALAAGVGLATLLATAAFVRWRTADLRRRQLELEAQIARRTADLRAANERLSALAAIDPLTGCLNRRRFMERALEHLPPGPGAAPVSLAILDLDNFKQINDLHGHPVGDAVLGAVGLAARDRIRAGDLIGRIGGEEFAVLMPGVSGPIAAQLAERLRLAVAEGQAQIGDLTIRPTASIGVATRRAGEDFASLYARADAALYAAKAGGRNRVMAARDDPAP